VRLGDGTFETPCPACRATWDCFCKCRERIRLLARETDALLAVADAARDLSSTHPKLALLVARYDAAAAARKAAP
jgi:hypothetical protein